MKCLFINTLTSKTRNSKAATKTLLCRFIHLITKPLRVATSRSGRTIETIKGEQNATPHLTFLTCIIHNLFLTAKVAKETQGSQRINVLCLRPLRNSLRSLRLIHFCYALCSKNDDKQTFFYPKRNFFFT